MQFFRDAMTPGGIGMAILRRALYGYVTHPNFAAVLLIGLGCETNQLQEFLDETGLKTGPRHRALNIQDQGAAATVGEGVAWVEALLAEADRVRRRDVPVANASAVLDPLGAAAHTQQLPRLTRDSAADAARAPDEARRVLGPEPRERQAGGGVAARPAFAR